MVQGILAGLKKGNQNGDRVQLMAVDLDAIPLSKTFVAPDSKEMADALAALDNRVPLGATDMEAAMNTVAASFKGESRIPAWCCILATAAAPPTC